MIDMPTIILKHNGQVLALAPLSPFIDNKTKLRKGSKSSCFVRETHVENVTGESMLRVALLMVNLNASEEVNRLSLLVD